MDENKRRKRPVEIEIGGGGDKIMYWKKGKTKKPTSRNNGTEKKRFWRIHDKPYTPEGN